MKSVILFIMMSVATGRTDYVKECGKPYRSESHVTVTHGQQPWQVAIYRATGEWLTDMDCEGALIAERFVLTAAQCVKGFRNSLFRVGLGQDDREGYPHENHRVRRKIVHERFNCTYSGCVNDIALIELAKPVRYRKYIVPVCLPEGDANFVGTTPTSSRWVPLVTLRTHQLEKFDVQVAVNEVCESLIKDNRRLDLSSNVSLPRPTVVDVNTAETSLCVHFDSRWSAYSRQGSALLLERDGRAQLIGLHSSGAPDGTGYAYYTNVSHYAEWIKTQILLYSNSEAESDEEGDLGTLLVELEDKVNEVISSLIAAFVVLLCALVLLGITLLTLFRYRKLTEQLKFDLDVATWEEPGSYLQGEQL